MRVTLIHNPKAGNSRIPSCEELVDAVSAHGWRVTPVDKKDLEKAVDDPGDAVVVAGGDGTVGKVSKRFAGTGVPIGVIPTGTANNVSRTLGIGVDVWAAIELLPTCVARDADLGVVAIGKKKECFLEGFGVGVFAYFMAECATKKDKKLRRALAMLAKVLASYKPHKMELELDGRDMTGDYVLAAVMNLRSLGPALALAPGALFDDGELEVALIRPEQASSLVTHLKRASLEGDIALPAIEVHRAKHVRIGNAGPWAHVDDCSREIAEVVDVKVMAQATKFLLPPAVASTLSG